MSATPPVQPLADAPVRLSYLLTTRNKLPFLREVVTRLVAQRQPDDEIIAIDAASTDGSAEFLRELHDQGAIQRFASESDRGEAHGYNKALMMARGELIKFITDDDAFHWTGLRACREFMLAHPAVDALGSNVGHVILERPEHLVEVTAYGEEFGRRQLPLAGLLCTGCVQVDFEYTLRITRLLNVAWWTGVAAVRIDNPGSNFRRLNAQCLAELDRIATFHQWAQPPPVEEGSDPRPAWTRMRHKLGAWRRKLMGRPLPDTPPPAAPTVTPGELFTSCEKWLEQQNGGRKLEFLTRQS
jgi:hypothetical protein